MKYDIERYQRIYDELKRIIFVLSQDYKPEKIYVFGSFVTKKVHAYSDLDILIVKKTNKPLMERLHEVRKLLKPKVSLDILVYNKNEIEANHNLYFIKEIISKGRCVWTRF